LFQLYLVGGITRISQFTTVPMVWVFHKQAYLNCFVTARDVFLPTLDRVYVMAFPSCYGEMEGEFHAQSLAGLFQRRKNSLTEVVVGSLGNTLPWFHSG